MSEPQDNKLSGMIASIVEDLNTLVRGHIELAKAEARDGISRVITSSILLIVSLAMLNLAIIFVFIAGALYLNNQGVALWVCFLIVMGGLLFGSVLLFIIGMRVLKKITFGSRTLDSFNETTRTLTDLKDF
jgi:uncharacterized membrane protein YgcG